MRDGTSTHGSSHGRRRRHRHGRLRPRGAPAGPAYAAQDQQQYDQQQQQYAPPPEPAAAPEDDQAAQLQNLAQLHTQGVLTDEEFAAAKAKILGI